MRQQDNVASICSYGFFFDESVRDCLPCEAVCGGNGRNDQECSARCQDFILKKSSSSTVAVLLGQYENQMKLDVWLVPAIASTMLALLSVGIVLGILWKMRKSIAPISSVECEERSLMRTEICQESSNASFNTAMTLMPPLTPILPHQSRVLCSDFFRMDDSYQVCHHCLNPISLNEDHRTSLKLNLVREEITSDSCVLSSPISLKSDPSVPCQLNLLDQDGGFKSSNGRQNSVVSSVLDMPHMFGWLNNTDWVMEYREDANGLHIGVEGIGKEKAEEMIRRKGHRLQDFQFVVASPSKGQYVPCPHTSSPEEPAHQGTYNTPSVLLPGMRIYSKEMEPDLDTGSCQPGHAIYSGSLIGGGGGSGGTLGLTVGHLFAKEHLELFLDENPIGRCVKKCEYIVHRALSKITADIALLEISLRSENMIRFDDRYYRLKLFKDELTVKPPSHIPVIILRYDGSVSEGQIADSMFTFKRCQLFNTLRIVDLDGNSQRISNEGDSGSLILSKPTSGSDYLYVYGMVIGYWINDEQTRSHTVATRLWNVLETLLSNSDSDFSNDINDSGFHSYS